MLTAADIKRILKMRSEGVHPRMIASTFDVHVSTVYNVCKRNQSSESTDPFIASDKTCKGCIYFMSLSSHYPKKNMCGYTYLTGKAKDITKPCAECDVKNMKGSAE